MKFKALYLETADLNTLSAFYTKTLGFSGKQNSLSAYELHIHDTRLVFGQGQEQPPYHFALHIPGGIEQVALRWLEERTEVLEYHGEKIQDFRGWNAKSLYFTDPASNVVEFIARPGIADNVVEFGPAAVAGLAEVGLATQNIKEIFERLESQLGMDIYDGDFEEFCAIGNDDALIICVDQDKKTWFPTSIPAEPAEFALQTDQGAVILYKDLKLHVYKSLDDALSIAEAGGTKNSAWLARAIGNLCGPRDGAYLDRVHAQLARYTSDQGDHKSALLHRRYNYKAALLKGDKKRLASTQRHLADTYRRLGRNSEAHSNYDEAISHYRDLGSPALEMANALRGLALVHSARGAEEKARSAWNRARHYYNEAGVIAGVEEADRMLGNLQEG